MADFSVDATRARRDRCGLQGTQPAGQHIGTGVPKATPSARVKDTEPVLRRKTGVDCCRRLLTCEARSGGNEVEFVALGIGKADPLIVVLAE